MFCDIGRRGFPAEPRISVLLISSERGFVMEFLMIVKRFLCDEQGMETVEWGVLAALIVAGLVAVIGTLGTNVLTKFTGLRDATS